MLTGGWSLVAGAILLSISLSSCTDMYTIEDAEPLEASDLMIAIVEDESDESIDRIIRENPGIIARDEDLYGRLLSVGGPLYMAAMMNRTNVVRTLIAEGADVEFSITHILERRGDEGIAAINLIREQQALIEGRADEPNEVR